jgi:hypothetical protein
MPVTRTLKGNLSTRLMMLYIYNPHYFIYIFLKIHCQYKKIVIKAEEEQCALKAASFNIAYEFFILKNSHVTCWHHHHHHHHLVLTDASIISNLELINFNSSMLIKYSLT